MSLASSFRLHPRLRWTVPLAAVAVLTAGTAGVGLSRARADSSLGPRSAAQLLVDVQQARLAGLSGTVVQTANLGLPELPGLAGRSTELGTTLTGSHTWRVWYGGPEKVRLALVGTLGESDVIRNGRDVWLWSSTSRSARHYTLDEHTKTTPSSPASPSLGQTPPPSGMPASPQEAADRALATLDPTTEVTSGPTTTVAGRSAYELVLRPRTSGSLVAQVRIAIDGAEHIPLRVQVYSVKTDRPAVEVGFTSVDFGVPADRQFTFTAPAGTTVTEGRRPGGAGPGSATPSPGASPSPDAAERPRLVGTGWSTIAVTKVGAVPTGTGGSAQGDTSDPTAQLRTVLQALPKVSGSWGSGRLLAGTLFSAVLTDDGRLAVGSVEPQRLYDALAAR